MPAGEADSPDGPAAADVIRLLDLTRHPEGGHFRETFRDRSGADGRALGTAIYYLLGTGERSRWHRVDAAEIWHWYAGAPLELSVGNTAAELVRHCLGPALERGERPQAIVPKDTWQSARSLGDWTLAGCTVAPGFDFAGFELAPDDWAPG